MLSDKKLTRKIIEIAINKGLQDIHENLHRGVRNLVDLGSIFAKENFQKNFFHKARSVLNNNSSIYYDIINHIIHNVDHRIIKTCGINLGYNSWIYGVNKIRKYKKYTKNNIPWYIVFDFRQQTNIMLSENEISDILTCGEDIGIYCGMFFVHKEFPLETLVTILNRHKNSIFFLFVPPELITVNIAQSIIQTNNTTIVIEIDSKNSNEQNKTAAEILYNKKCLYGAYSLYNDSNVEFIMTDFYFLQLEALRCPFVFLIREKNQHLQKEEQFSKFIKQAKNFNEKKLFIFDFYQDLAYIDQTISQTNSFLAIKPDGKIALTFMDKLYDELNIKKHCLKSILEKQTKLFSLSK